MVEPEIIFENENIVAINKPAGLVVHADGRTDEKTLADWLVKSYPEIKKVGEPLVLSDGTSIDRPGIVHRLDRETSGIMVAAKDQETFLFLKEQFQKRAIEKTYNAFVYGKLKEKEGVIDRPIGKSKKNFRQWLAVSKVERSAQRGARGAMREAVTAYKVLKEGEEFSFIEIKPRTGRTHQIRVHFKAIHHPIVCDKLYAPKRECALGFNRLALHSLSLQVTLPDSTRAIFEAPLPDDFKYANSLLAT